MNRVLDKVVGGWQIAGTGTGGRTNWFTLPTSYYPTDNRTSKSTATSTRSRIARAAPATPVTCIGTATFRRTGSIATMPTASPTASWAFRPTTNPLPAPLIPWGQTALAGERSGRNQSHAVLGHQHRMDSPEQRQGAAHYIQQQPDTPGETSTCSGLNQWFQDASLFKFVELHREGQPCDSTSISLTCSTTRTTRPASPPPVFCPRAIRAAPPGRRNWAPG